MAHVQGESPIPRADSSREFGVVLFLIYAVVLGTVISILTLPFIAKVWLGELPILAAYQLPKVGMANWLTDALVIPFMKSIGVDQGSRSPNLIVAQPYAMALTYLGFYGGLVLLGLGMVDFLAFMAYRSQPGLSIY